jgi:hypothetical protein
MWPIAIPFPLLLVDGGAVDDLDHGVQKPPAALTAFVGVALEALFGMLLVYQDDVPVAA